MRGKDSIGVCEYFQYHDEQLRDRGFKLSNTDKFFRIGFGPMHLMTFSFFNNLVDDFLNWCKKQDFYIKEDWEFDRETVPYDLFLTFFAQD